VSDLVDTTGPTRARGRAINHPKGVNHPPPAGESQEMTGAQYAEHLGVSAPAVCKALKSGVLDAAVRWTVRGSQRVATIIDVTLADRIWLARPGARAPALASPPVVQKASVPPTAPGPDAAPLAPWGTSTLASGENLATLAEARLLLEQSRAQNERLKFERDSGLVVETARAREIYGRQIQAAKTRIMGLGKLARSRIPHLSTDDVITIEDLCREALEGLSADVLDGPKEGSQQP
jgi:hypothetical protein